MNIIPVNLFEDDAGQLLLVCVHPVHGTQASYVGLNEEHMIGDAIGAATEGMSAWGQLIDEHDIPDLDDLDHIATWEHVATDPVASSLTIHSLPGPAGKEYIGITLSASTEDFPLVVAFEEVQS